MTNREQISCATITFDKTLADLFHDDKPGTSQVVLCASCPSSETDFHRHQKRSKKFVYQDAAVNIERQTVNEAEDFCHESAVQYLALRSQRFAIVCGKMPCIMFDVTDQTDSDGRRDAEETFSCIVGAQQPEVRFYRGPKDVVMQPGETLSVTLPMDGLEKHPHIISADIHYELLSKRGLAISGLCTPSAEVIDIGTFQELAIVDDEEARKSIINKEIDSIVEKVISRAIPFVLKLQQTVSGEGTMDMLPIKISQKK